MKQLTKKLWVFVMVLGLVLSASSTVSAATYYTTGLEDGLYEATTTPNAEVMNTFYKLSVVIEAGKITTGSFELRTEGYPAAITASFAAAAPTQETKDFISNTCPEVEDYSSQLINTGDGALVTKSSLAVEGSVVFNEFSTLWKDVVEQAGGEIVEEGAGNAASTDATDITDTVVSSDSAGTTDVPKTGVVSFGTIFGVGVITSAAGFALSKNNRSLPPFTGGFLFGCEYAWFTVYLNSQRV